MTTRSLKLEDVCNLITDGKHGDCQNERDSGYFFLSAKDVKEGNLNYKNARQITKRDFLEVHKRTRLEPLDILVSNSGTIGRMAIAKDAELTGRTTFQKSVAILKPDKAQVCPKWLLYYLYNVSNELIAVAGGTAQKNLLLRDLRSFNIQTSPLPTQQKIAAVLSAYDDLIENNTRRIKILEEMAQAIYREWFVDFRFPGHEKVKMVDSPLGEIPDGWEAAKLSALVEPQYGYTETASQEQIGPKFLRGTDINKRPYVNWAEVPYCQIDKNDYEKYKLNKGDIVIIRMADPGKVGMVEKDVDAVFASYLIRLAPKVPIRQYYLFYLLSSDHYQDFVSGASTGTTRKSASAGVLTDINVILPPAEIQRHFDELIATLRMMLNTVLEKNANLRAARDLLLPKLISGEIDVSDLDIQTERPARLAANGGGPSA